MIPIARLCCEMANLACRCASLVMSSSHLQLASGANSARDFASQKAATSVWPSRGMDPLETASKLSRTSDRANRNAIARIVSRDERLAVRASCMLRRATFPWTCVGKDGHRNVINTALARSAVVRITKLRHAGVLSMGSLDLYVATRVQALRR